MKTRTGKIARLPRLIRDELNRRLDDGQEGKKLVRWLNGLPEVRQVMAESFEGKPVTEQNLSEWRAGGFAEWVGRQEFLEQARELGEEAEELRAVSTAGNRASFAEYLSTVLALRYATLLKGWQGEAGEAVAKQLRLLHGLSHDVARLARVGLERQRVELTREKSQAELVELFTDWVEIPEVREAVCEDYVKLADRKRALCQLYHQPYEEEIRGPKCEGRKAKGLVKGGVSGTNPTESDRVKPQKKGYSGSKPLTPSLSPLGRGEGEGKEDGRRGAFRDARDGRGPRAGEFTAEPLRTKSGRKRWLKDPTTCDGLGRVPYRTAAEKKAAEQAAGQKRMDENAARAYIRSHPDGKKQGLVKGGVSGTNPTESDRVKPQKKGYSGSKPLTPSLSPLGRGEGEGKEDGRRGAFRDTGGGCGPRAGEFTAEPLRTKSGRKRWLKDPTTCDGLGRVPYRTAAEKKAAEQAAGQKRMDENAARAYIRSHPDGKKQGLVKGGVSGTNPTESDRVKPQKKGYSGSKPLTPSLSPLGRGEGEGKEGGTRGAFRDARGGRGPQAGNRAQSGPIVPKALEAEVARLNRGVEGDLPGDETDGNDEPDGADWDAEDAMLLKQAEEARQRREAAQKAEAERLEEEAWRLWRVDFGFEEPTEEDIALGRTKRKRWNKAGQGEQLVNANSRGPAGQ